MNLVPQQVQLAQVSVANTCKLKTKKVSQRGHKTEVGHSGHAPDNRWHPQVWSCTFSSQAAPNMAPQVSSLKAKWFAEKFVLVMRLDVKQVTMHACSAKYLV